MTSTITTTTDSELRGDYDAYFSDADGDGVSEWAYIDTDGDGAADTGLHDADGDGLYEWSSAQGIQANDEPLTGTASTETIDSMHDEPSEEPEAEAGADEWEAEAEVDESTWGGDAASGSVALEYGQDCSAFADPTQLEHGAAYDMDGDGFEETTAVGGDALLIDYDGNGVDDSFLYDTDHDGVLDLACVDAEESGDSETSWSF